MLIFFSQTNVFNSISLIFSAIAGGGFVPASDIITPDHPERLAILAVGMILSALPFAFHYRCVQQEGSVDKDGN